MTKQKGELNFLLTNLHVIELLTSDTIHFTSDTIHFGYHTFQTLAVLSFPHTAGAECCGTLSYQIEPLTLYLYGTTPGESAQWERGSLEPNTTLGWMAGTQLHTNVPANHIDTSHWTKTRVSSDSPELDPGNTHDHINTIWMEESRTKNWSERATLTKMSLVNILLFQTLQRLVALGTHF